MEFFIVFIVMALICAVIGYFIDGIRGAALGGILGVIGVVIAAILHAKDNY